MASPYLSRIHGREPFDKPFPIHGIDLACHNYHFTRTTSSLRVGRLHFPQTICSCSAPKLNISPPIPRSTTFSPGLRVRSRKLTSPLHQRPSTDRPGSLICGGRGRYENAYPSIARYQCVKLRGALPFMYPALPSLTLAIFSA